MELPFIDNSSKLRFSGTRGAAMLFAETSITGRLNFRITPI